MTTNEITTSVSREDAVALAERVGFHQQPGGPWINEYTGERLWELDEVLMVTVQHFARGGD